LGGEGGRDARADPESTAEGEGWAVKGVETLKAPRLTASRSKSTKAPSLDAKLAKGVEGGRNGEWDFRPSPTRSLGERRELPRGVRGWVRPKTDFSAFQTSQNVFVEVFVNGKENYGIWSFNGIRHELMVLGVIILNMCTFS